MKIYQNPIYIKSIREISANLPVKEGRILVTGATGLIGSCIIDVLIFANREYNCQFDIYALGRNEKNLRARFEYAKEQVQFIVQNVTAPLKIEKKIDYIIHTASNADPQSYALYPVETILTNIKGAESVLEYAKEMGCRVLLTSTFEVYGKGEQDIYSENDYGTIDLNIVRNCYPESKRTTEILFRSFWQEYDVDIVIARLASIYGPTMKTDDSKAHAQFLRNGMRGENIILKSSGKQKRTYCYVMDAVSGLFTVLFQGKSGEIYNVANKESCASIAELAELIARLTGTKVVYAPPNETERKGFSMPQNCILATEKIENLGWRGNFLLEQGILDTLTILKEIS